MATTIKKLVKKQNPQLLQTAQPTDAQLISERDSIAEERAKRFLEARNAYKDAEIALFNLEKIYGTEFVKSLVEKYKI